ncbi:alpha-L-rhamnosidase [Opitutaceae bacterium TAV4]|nr:alpha-L-rhamnosidase [Opitutaceae bacterium TAV4]
MRPTFQSNPPPPRAPLPFIWRDATLHAAPNTWTYFRKIFTWTPGNNGTSTHADFAADPTARVWLNGHLILDRVLRFVTPHISIETLDLTPHLVAGENVLVVLHHWWGVPTFQRSPGGKPGIALVCEQNDATTDATWHWRPADEFTSHPHQTIGHDGSRRIRFPILLDTRLERPALHTPAGDGHPDWRSATPVTSDAWSKPTRKETPPLTLHEHIPPARLISTGHITRTAATAALPVHEVGRRIRETLHHPDRGAGVPPADDNAQRHPLPLGPSMLDVGCSTFGDYATLDFARPVHGYLTLEITDARAGTVWEIGYNELATNPRDLTPLLTPDGHFDPEFTCGTPFGDQIILRGGPQTITLPEERTWRYLLIHQTTMNSEQGSVNSEQGAVPNPSDPLFTVHCSLLTAISCRVSQHPVTQTGTFNLPHPSTFDSTTLQPLIRLCLDHARITMSDTYVDTTGREDAQWLEDIQYRARLAATWFGDTTLRQVTLRHAVEQQDPQTGLFRVFAPEDYASSGCQFLDWGMTWIGLLHDDWQWTGSTQLLRRYYPALKKFLTALKHLTTPDGLLTGHNCLSDNHGSARLNHTNLGDAPGYESIPNTWYYGYLQQSAEIADAIGETTDATDYRQRAAQLRNAFQRFITRDASVPPAGNAEPQLGTQCRPLGHATLGDTIAELWTPACGPHAYGQAAVVNAIFHGLIPDRATARAMLQTAFPAPDRLPPPPPPPSRTAPAHHRQRTHAHPACRARCRRSETHPRRSQSDGSAPLSAHL